MPSLRDYLVGRIEDAGYTLSDVELVTWDTGVEYLDGTSWVPVDTATFSAAAAQVDTRDVDPDARSRIRFHMQDGPVFQWFENDFSRVDNVPRMVTVTPAMLRGE